jgi:hypothetical protein
MLLSRRSLLLSPAIVSSSPKSTPPPPPSPSQQPLPFFALHTLALKKLYNSIRAEYTIDEIREDPNLIKYINELITTHDIAKQLINDDVIEEMIMEEEMLEELKINGIRV